MTEYLVVVGLVAVVLAGAVRGFGRQLDVTIQGAAGVDTIRDRMAVDDVCPPEGPAPALDAPAGGVR